MNSEIMLTILIGGALLFGILSIMISGDSELVPVAIVVGLLSAALWVAVGSSTSQFSMRVAACKRGYGIWIQEENTGESIWHWADYDQQKEEEQTHEK